MDAKLYAIPIGAFGNEIVTIMDICVPDLLISINEETNHLFENKEEIQERYDGLNEIKTIPITQAQEIQFVELKEAITKENELKFAVLSSMEESLKEAMEQLDGPRIQMANEMDLRMLDDEEENDGFPKIIL